jgi:hypothetical protein
MKNIPESHFRNINRFSGNSAVVGDLDPRWNVLDGEDLKVEDMFQLHYTNMGTQPWGPSWYKGPVSVHPRPELCTLWKTLRDQCHKFYVPFLKPNIDYPAYGAYNIIGQ